MGSFLKEERAKVSQQGFHEELRILFSSKPLPKSNPDVKLMAIASCTCTSY